ncbi:RNA-binding protein [Kitasatospora terrestris]|uniref:RNA-binding protein n=1 Tax=Kitasatospora terrestris TaxID=258051 RepID=UPI0031E64676
MPEIRVHRVTKYDPADRDERGHYTGPLDCWSDEGPVEAAYLETVAAFARAAGIDRLTVRDPGLSGPVHFGLGPLLDGHGLSGLFPEPAAFHDGAEVDLATAVELVRVMLRESGAWCRLEADERFFVHVGYDLYMYIGTTGPYEPGMRRAQELGLFPEPLAESPYAPAPDGSTPKPPADGAFWERVRRAVAAGEVQLLEEEFAGGAARWHHLTPDTVDAVRAGLAARSLLALWPDTLSADQDAVLGGLDPENDHRILREHADGRLSTCWIDPEDPQDIAVELASTRRVAAVSHEPGPLLVAVLPDADGVVRVRGTT